MIVRAKTKRRLVFLLVGVLLAVSVLAALYVIRRAQRQKYYLGLRDSGLVAYKAGDYLTTLNNLAIYTGRYRDDADALYYLAEARRRVETPDGSRHLLLTIQHYRRVLELRPDREDVRRDLVLLYSKLGYSNEVIDLADRILEKKPDDVPVLVAKARAQAVLRNYKESLATAQLAVKAAPLDVEAQAMTLKLYGLLDRKQDVLPHAQAILDSHPEDGRAELLMAVACMVLSDLSPEQQTKIRALMASRYPDVKLDVVTARMAAMVFVRKAAQRKISDLAYARFLVAQLDLLRLPAEAAEVLDLALASAKEDDPPLRRNLVRRFFEIGRYADVEKRLADVALKPAGPEVDMMALKAVSLVALGRQAEAAAIADTLLAQPNDRHARAWGCVLKEVIITRSDSLKAAEAIRADLDATKVNPHLRYYLGEIYASLGERDLAIDSLRQASAQAPLWPLPLLRLSRLFLEDGQSTHAREAATVAADLMRNVTGYANLATVYAASANKSEALRDPDLARLLAEVQRNVPGEERTLPLYVVVMAKSGQRATAERAFRDALDPQKKPSESLLLSLAAASQEAQLGLEGDCYALAEKLYGTSPDLVFSRAMQLFAAGKAADGAKLFDDARTNPGADKNLAWQIAWARYLDQTGDARAAAAWVALGDDAANKSNLSVQRAALAARSVQSDRPFLGRTIDRIRAVTGEQSMGWRIARARLLMTGDGATSDLDEAAKLLTEAITSAPSHAESRQMLALVQERLGNTAAAIEHLGAALKLDPTSDAMMLDLARLCQAKSELPRAREQLDRIRPDQLDAARRRQFIALLAQHGETARAAALMESQAGASTNPSDLFLLAELYRHRNQNDKAEPLFRELLKKPTAPVVIAAARFYASIGRKPEAEKILEALDGLSLEPGLRQLALAEYHAAYGKPEQALEQYNAAVQAAPANPNTWRSLLAHHLRAGRLDDALSTANEALKKLPGNPVMDTFVRYADDLKAVGSDVAFLPLMLSLLQTSVERDAALEAIRIGADVDRKKQPPMTLVNRLRPIADRAPTMVPLQAMLMARYMALGRTDDAVAIAQRSVKMAPTSVEIAQLAAQAFGASNDWTQALVAGNHWRELSLGRPLPADLFLAEAQFRLGNYTGAANQIAPYLEAARAAPDDYAGVLVMQARILITRGEADQAAELLWPSVGKSASWRRIWLDLVVSMSSSPTLAASWLERVTPVVPESATEEHVTLAQVWHQLGRQTGNSAYTDKARAIVAQLASRPEKPPQLYFSLATLAEQDGKLDEAEKLYRQSLQAQPDFPAVQNNLAMVIMGRNGDLAEAVRLATQAVRAVPQSAAFLDTLGQVQAKAKDYKSAIASLSKATQLDPANPIWLINLAHVYDQAGKPDDAERLVGQVEAILKGKQLPPPYQARLQALRAKAAATRPASTAPARR